MLIFFYVWKMNCFDKCKAIGVNGMIGPAKRRRLLDLRGESEILDFLRMESNTDFLEHPFCNCYRLIE